MRRHRTTRQNRRLLNPAKTRNGHLSANARLDVRHIWCTPCRNLGEPRDTFALQPRSDPFIDAADQLKIVRVCRFDTGFVISRLAFHVDGHNRRDGYSGSDGQNGRYDLIVRARLHLCDNPHGSRAHHLGAVERRIKLCSLRWRIDRGRLVMTCTRFSLDMCCGKINRSGEARLPIAGEIDAIGAQCTRAIG